MRTERKESNSAFFTGDRKSPWPVVAISMVGTSISGVTFISVPGQVAATQMSYMQMVFGFFAGYIAIAFILLPLYYRLASFSIYGYLSERFGPRSRRTGSAFFLLSKFLGCGVRMYLTAIVLQVILFGPLGIPFLVNILVTMLVVWLYTFRGGVKTLVWVDMVQTLCMVGAVILSIVFVCQALGYDFRGLVTAVSDSPMSRIWFFDDPTDKKYFWKQFLAGTFTTIAMTGLDQDMMQKNLSCKNLRAAQKNVLSYGFSFVPINLLFLCLGVLLYRYGSHVGLCDVAGHLHGLKPDELYPVLATGTDPVSGARYLPLALSVIFVVGLVSAAFSSAGSAVTALTTTVTVDLLGADRRGGEAQLTRTRHRVHAAVCLIMAVLIYAFRAIGNGSVINAVYVVASYTYGPLLGLYAYGLFSRRQPRDRRVPWICVCAPLLCLVLSLNAQRWFGFGIGYELLLINAALTVVGLAIASLGKETSPTRSPDRSPDQKR
ncbi:MAG: sodium:solute symporter [Bacteroidales bacterium]|nr:sodium:solute symporter [Bacteroidales bacterium]